MDSATLSKPLLTFWTARRGPQRHDCVFSRVASGFVVEVVEHDVIVRSAVASSLDELFQIEGLWRAAWSADGWDVI